MMNVRDVENENWDKEKDWFSLTQSSPQEHIEDYMKLLRDLSIEQEKWKIKMYNDTAYAASHKT